MTLRRMIRLLSIVAVLAAGGTAIAEDEPAPWEFEVTPYAWIPANYGTIDVRGRTARLDVSIDDVLNLVFDGDALAGGLYASVRYDRWSAFVDAFGGFAEEKSTASVCCASIAAKTTVYPVIVDVGMGYRLGAWMLPARRRPLTLGVYAGTRVMYLGTDVRADVDRPGFVARTLDASKSFSWADPMIGLRWEVPVHDRISLEFRGDIGGFGASSELIWGLVGGFRWWLPWSPWSTRPWLGLGYRAISFDHDFNDGNNANLEFRGPYSAIGFAF
jgi:hypothetical protein